MNCKNCKLYASNGGLQLLRKWLIWSTTWKQEFNLAAWCWTTKKSYAKSSVHFLPFNVWHWRHLGTGTFEHSMTLIIHWLGISPLFHCLVCVSWFCSCHIFLKPFFPILHFIVSISFVYVFQDSALSNIFHNAFILNTFNIFHILSFFVAIYVNVVTCLPCS